jgi:hypothetical protein
MSDLRAELAGVLSRARSKDSPTINDLTLTACLESLLKAYDRFVTVQASRNPEPATEEQLTLDLGGV